MLGKNLTSQDFFRAPAATIEQLRRAGPVVQIRLPVIGRVWTTTTQELAGAVLKDSAMFSLRRESGALAGLRWWMPPLLRSLAENMLTMDEPDHTRLRGIVDEAFRRRAVLDLEPRIRAIADRLAGDLFAAGSPADLVDPRAQGHREAAGDGAPGMSTPFVRAVGRGLVCASVPSPRLRREGSTL